VRAPTPSTGAARPSLLGWLGRGASPAPARAAPPVTAPAPETPATGSVDLAPLARVPAPPTPPPVPSPPVRQPPKPVAAPNGQASTVYRSGVIDGMAYTLFMDGSIQAELPHGTVKFTSVDDLQKYLLGNR